MRLGFKCLRIGNLLITTRKSIDHTKIILDRQDLFKIVELLEKDGWVQ